MGKKLMNMFLFLAVAAAAVGMTVYVGQGAVSVMIYNFIFLGIMILIYLIGMFGGMFKMNRIAEALQLATEELGNIFKNSGKVASEKLVYLTELFGHKYLDQKMENFTASISASEEGIGEIEDYLNEGELDLYVHKRLLEMVPDIFTSLGILGTFIGLVWGLKDFQPNNYEAMTSSVSVLVDGIKVAFVTSIYGIAFSIIYTFGMKNEYSAMTERLQVFLEKFHSCVMPTAENESRNLMVASQKNQTAAMNQMAEQFSVQMAESFEKIITPTFSKMNASLDTLTTTVVRGQQDALRDILNAFLREFNSSFKFQFQDFNVALDQMKKVQKENVAYTAGLYQEMSQLLSESYAKQDSAMKNMMAELNSVQGQYMNTANRILQENQAIQKQQQVDYQHLADYLKEAEKSSAKFWVACNQTMQKYVEAAAETMDNVSLSEQAAGRVIEEFSAKMHEYAEYQKMSYKAMEQVRKLLADITVAKDNKEIFLKGGAAADAASKEALEKLQEAVESQGEGQKVLLEDMAKNIRDISKAAQKGKFSLFR